MSDKQTFWMTDEFGAKALVTGVDERNRLRPHGWRETTEPTGQDLVWLRHDVTEGQQLFSHAAAGQWAELGWHPSPPPEPVDLTKDPMLVDQAAAPAPAVEDSKPRTQARATSGDEKE